MRFTHVWISRQGFVRAFLFCVGAVFVHDIIVQDIIRGQGTRNLIDLTQPPVQPPAQPSTQPPAQPSGTAPVPSIPNRPAVGGTVSPPSLPSLPSPPSNPIGLPGGNTPSATVPALSSGFLKAMTFPPASNASTDSPQTSAPAVLPKTPEKSPRDMATSVLEEYTEDDREEQEILSLRQQAANMADPEQCRAEMDRISVMETNFRNRQTRRAIDEADAKLFYVPRIKEQYLKEGWCQLFDGHTNFGWEIQTQGPYAGGKFTFDQNELCSDDYFPGLIYTQMPFGNVNVRFNYWAEKDSEVYLLMKTSPDPADLKSSCYAFVLNSRQSSYSRGLPLGRHGLSPQELRERRELWDNPKKEEEETWHSFSVKFAKNQFEIWLDKHPPEVYFDGNPIASGHIAFLVAKGKARFRDVLWQPNQTVPLFDTLQVGALPWRLSDGTEFSQQGEDVFHLPRGSVESKELFTNFVFQMEYFQGMNSGKASLSVRSIPGQENTGYEVSLQNFPRLQDRKSVVGVDAGSFRQFKDARYTRPQDRRWTYLTIAAMGRQFQTWVNGVPVCLIEDKRKTLSATGPFLEPGAIRLSVPQENTLLQFRHLSVSTVLP